MAHVCFLPQRTLRGSTTDPRVLLSPCIYYQTDSLTPLLRCGSHLSKTCQYSPCETSSFWGCSWPICQCFLKLNSSNLLLVRIHYILSWLKGKNWSLFNSGRRSSSDFSCESPLTKWLFLSTSSGDQYQTRIRAPFFYMPRFKLNKFSFITCSIRTKSVAAGVFVAIPAQISGRLF